MFSSVRIVEALVRNPGTRSRLGPARRAGIVLSVFIAAAGIAVALCGLLVLVVLAALGGPSPAVAHAADVAWLAGSIVLILAAFALLLLTLSAAVNPRP